MLLQPAIYAFNRWEVDLGRRELRAAGATVPIGGRAFEIIEVLVQSAGQLVAKDELMDRVWPGTIVEENTLQVHISAVRKALGADRSLLKTASGRGYRLLGAWTARQVDRITRDRGEAPASTAPPRTNLPASASPMIGRESATQQLRDLLSAYRAVTLTGPGGIGKSRLALEVARDLLPVFDGDCWLVDLVAIANPDLVPSAVVSSLGLTFGGETPSAAAVARAIGPRRLLLVLDNCEHIIDAAAGLAEAIVRMCPHATMLVTSRELLRIEGERAFRVQPLDVPVADVASADDLLRHSAVQLLIARMHSEHAGSALGKADLAAAASICRNLDGIPLAIELAAGRAAALGLDTVLSRLDERFKLLTAGRRTALPRHQTLRATLDWSYALLPPEEQALLRFLSVFPAGFTLDAAAGVTSDPDGLVDGIGNLVAKSLLDRSGASARWRLLETTRAYLIEKLADQGELDEAKRRHAGFYRDLLVRLGAATEPGTLGERMAPYVAEIGNVRAALDWAFSESGDPAVGIALTAGFLPAWLHLSLLVECCERASQALAHAEALAVQEALDVMQLHIALGLSLLYTTGLVAKTEAALAKGLALAERLDDVPGQLIALWGLWFYHMTSGELRDAEPIAERFPVVAWRSDDEDDHRLADHIIGNTMHFKGNQTEARGYFDRVLAAPAAPANQRHPTWILNDVRVPARAMLARVLLLQGQFDRAAHDARASFEEERALGRPLSICAVLRFAVCPVAFLTGDLQTASWSVAMVTDLAARHGSAFWSRIGRCLEGALLIRQGNLSAGTVILREALKTVRNRPPDLLGVLAEGLTGLGDGPGAVATVDERLDRSEKTAERWYDPELLRLKGEALACGDGGQAAAESEACFQRALEMAREQGAMLWELRAALSLAGLRVRQGRPQEARNILMPVQLRFTEGRDTADLRAAGALIARLPPADA